jgi:phosphatidate cytidylyltransferase
MSRATTPSGRATVASRTTFEALAVDSGEESEEEQVAAQPTPPPERSVCKLMYANGTHVYPYSEPPKPSKSALKKAAKTARTEKRQQQKAAKNRISDNSQGESSESPVATAYEPIKVLHGSYEIVPATPDSKNASLSVPDEAPLETTVDLTAAHIDGNVHDGISSPEPSYPTSMDTSGRNSPDPLDDPTADKNSYEDPLNEELQLALQNKLDRQQAAERTKKKQNAITRTLWGFIMIGGFIGTFSDV